MNVTSIRASLRPRRLLGIGLGLAGAAAIGVMAALFADRDPAIRGLIFALCFAPPFVALCVLWLDNLPGTDSIEYPEQSVEHQWMQQAMAAAFGDLMIAISLVTVVLGITRIEIEAAAVLVALTVTGLADVSLRIVRVTRRHSGDAE